MTSTSTRPRKIGRKIILVCVFFFNASVVRAEGEMSAIWENDRPHYLNLFVSPHFTNISKGGFSVTGAGVGAGAQFGLNRLFAVGAAFNQTFDIGSISPLYSSIDLFGVFAITGQISPMDRTITSNEKSIVSLHEYDDGGFRAKFYFTRYFFNATTANTSFTGVGGSVSYQLPSTNDYNYFFGLRADLIGNSVVTLTPISLFGGLSFQLM